MGCVSFGAAGWPLCAGEGGVLGDGIQIRGSTAGGHPITQVAEATDILAPLESLHRLGPNLQQTPATETDDRHETRRRNWFHFSRGWKRHPAWRTMTPAHRVVFYTILDIANEWDRATAR